MTFGSNMTFIGCVRTYGLLSINDDVCHDLSLEEDDDDDDNTMRKPIHATS